jgi:hypothetical protein
MTTLPGTPRFARSETSRPAFPAADAVGPNDTRIMLHMLLSEARNYHGAETRASKRAPVSVARPAFGGTQCGDESLSMSACSMDSSYIHVAPPGCESPNENNRSTAHPETDTPPPLPMDESPSDSDDSVESVYDAWADLQMQIEDAWAGPGESSHAARYARIKSYLTWMFIWDPSRDWSDFEEVSAAASLEWITQRQVARLNRLQPGKFFIES